MEYGRRAILALLLLGGAALSCQGDRAVGERYDIERRFYQLERRFSDTRIRPGLTSSDAWGELTDEYARLYTRCRAALAVTDSAGAEVERAQVADLTFRTATRLTQLLFSSRAFDSCVTLLNEVLAEVPLNRDNAMNAWANLGRALQAAGQWDSAVTVYDRAIEIFRPPVLSDGTVFFRLFNVPLHLYSVVRQVDAGARAEARLAAAERYYHGLAEEYPGTAVEPAAWSNLGRLYEQAQRWRDAMAAYGKLRNTKGELPATVELRIADLYAAGLGDYQEALSRYEQLEQRITAGDTLLRPAIFFKRSLALLGLGRYEEARRLLVKLEQNWPQYYYGNPSAQYAKAQSFEKEGNWNRAESEYAYLVERFAGTPQALSAYLHVVSAFREIGDTVRASQWYRRAMDDFDRLAARQAGSPAAGLVLLHKAQLLVQEGNREEAVRLYAEIHEKHPRTDPGYTALIRAARLYRQMGDTATSDSLLAVVRRELTEVDDRGGF